MIISLRRVGEGMITCSKSNNRPEFGILQECDKRTLKISSCNSRHILAATSFVLPYFLIDYSEALLRLAPKTAPANHMSVTSMFRSKTAPQVFLQLKRLPNISIWTPESVMENG